MFILSKPKQQMGQPLTLLWKKRMEEELLLLSLILIMQDKLQLPCQQIRTWILRLPLMPGMWLRQEYW